MRHIILMGNPNVGKSLIFNHLTGARVMSANYPGTTVEFTRGYMQWKGERSEVIDAPGTYSLEAACRAEAVAVSILGQADLVISVIDATNLERNLYLTLQLLERQCPMIVALNLIDEAARKGIAIDVRQLEECLGVPVVPTAGLTGQGLRALVDRLDEARAVSSPPLDEARRWTRIGAITRRVQQIAHRHPTWLERLQDASVRPLTGVPLAAMVLYLTFRCVVGIGEGLSAHVLQPLLDRLYLPLLTALSQTMAENGLLHRLLLGELVDGRVDVAGSFGVLSTGVYIALTVVFPYILTFYAALGLLEDSGYLPRLAVVADNLFHRVGLHGYALLPFLLGLGCNVPGALALRNLESRRERLISAVLLTVTIPCAAQAAMIYGLVGRHGGQYLALVFAALFFLWALLGVLADRWVTGMTPAMIVELPPYRVPHLSPQLYKLRLRVMAFFGDGLPYILGGMLLVNLLWLAGVVPWLARLTAPVFTGAFGLPPEAVSTLLIGLLRKDVAVAMLQPLHLDPHQLVVSAVVLATYFPCFATFIILWRELGVRDVAVAIVAALGSALVVGTALNLALNHLLPAGALAALLAAMGVGLLYIVPGCRRLKLGHPFPHEPHLNT